MQNYSYVYLISSSKTPNGGYRNSVNLSCIELRVRSRYRNCPLLQCGREGRKPVHITGTRGPIRERYIC